MSIPQLLGLPLRDVRSCALRAYPFLPSASNLSCERRMSIETGEPDGTCKLNLEALKFSGRHRSCTSQHSCLDDIHCAIHFTFCINGPFYLREVNRVRFNSAQCAGSMHYFVQCKQPSYPSLRQHCCSNTREPRLSVCGRSSAEHLQLASRTIACDCASNVASLRPGSE